MVGNTVVRRYYTITLLVLQLPPNVPEQSRETNSEASTGLGPCTHAKAGICLSVWPLRLTGKLTPPSADDSWDRLHHPNIHPPPISLSTPRVQERQRWEMDGRMLGQNTDGDISGSMAHSLNCCCAMKTQKLFVMHNCAVDIIFLLKGTTEKNPKALSLSQSLK